MSHHPEDEICVQTQPDHDGHRLEVSFPSLEGNIDVACTGYDGMATVTAGDRLDVAAAFLDVEPEWLADKLAGLGWLDQMR